LAWSFGDIILAASGAVAPDDPAIICSGRETSWADFMRRAQSIGAAFFDAGVAAGDKVAHFLRNGPAYLETSAACFLSGLVHVNVNFRYKDRELLGLLDNSDSAVVVYDAEFAPAIAALRAELPKVRLFVEVGDTPPLNTFAIGYETLAEAGAKLFAERSASDLIMIYTGGTTGLPRGVMWPHESLWAAMGSGAPEYRAPPPKTLGALQENIRAGLGRERALICPPLMHGSGYLKAIYTLSLGGTVVLEAGRGFDPRAILAVIEQQRVTTAVIVGDPFARPLLNELDAAPNAFDLSSLRSIISGGAIWSAEVKAGLLRHCPGLNLVDSYGASESIGVGTTVTNRSSIGQPQGFKRSELTRVVREDGGDVEPGSREIGRVIRAGPMPLGYYKDPEKTAKTFVTLNGIRYVIPGDYAQVELDGTMRLMGRGSLCINTGGEKVFVEEVEETLKAHPSVTDALVVGLADERWGQSVNAVVALSAPVEQTELREFVRNRLADYKAPKKIIVVAEVPRGPNGKADYASARALCG
jgi:fatty-acyl-CoA synthase